MSKNANRSLLLQCKQALNILCKVKDVSGKFNDFFFSGYFFFLKKMHVTTQIKCFKYEITNFKM